MQKAVIIGGSNGIGLAVSLELIKQGYHAVILDIAEPDEKYFQELADKYTFIRCNLLDLDESIIEQLRDDADVKLLMITAGFGRVTPFESLHTAEIKNMLQVNTVSALKIVRIFYDRIMAKEPFYCGMMGSIAGLISSPMFSVYAASKAAVCRFIESVNIELEFAGTDNRILNVSPGSVKGTRFNKGENDMELVSGLAREIVSRLFNSETLYIPEYDTIYKGVIERYNNDPHAYGVSSYQYKLDSGRFSTEKRVRIGYLSGTFDLFHVGHLNLLRNAKQYCDYLIVGVHPDASHKGKVTFIPFEERMQIVGAVKYVDKVVRSCPEDCDAWDTLHYTHLFVGSDYKGTERFMRYEEYFKDKGVEIVYFPYTQGTSSTQIREKIISNDKGDKQ
ncbi:MAG TPA: SDR family NAD(P)-dependent oxidoreductase [Ruminococcus flavefaciens]|nr:SDR family NAD(P)-dependent oxidoreductase [Ruminococcus flavefaciens]